MRIASSVSLLSRVLVFMGDILSVSLRHWYFANHLARAYALMTVEDLAETCLRKYLLGTLNTQWTTKLGNPTKF